MSRILGLLFGMLVVTMTIHGDSRRDVDFVQAKNETQRADLNGDPLPPGALVRMGSTRWRHGEAVSYVAFTPDDKSVVTMSQDGVLRLWERETGKELRRFDTKVPGPKAPVVPAPIRVPFNQVGVSAAKISLSKDGKTLAAALANSTIRLWEVDTGKQIRDINGPAGGAIAIVFSPDSKSIAARTFDRTLHFFDVTSGKELSQIKGKQIDAAGAVRVLLDGQGGREYAGMAYSHDGKAMATSELEADMNMQRSYIRISDVETGKQLRRFDVAASGASAIAYSPDGKHFAMTSASSATLFLRDADANKELHRINLATGATSLAFSPDSTMIAVKCRDQVIRVYDTAKGEKLHELGNPTAPAMPIPGGVAAFVIQGSPSGDGRDLAFSGDSKTLVTGNGQTVRFFNVGARKEQSSNTSGHRGAVTNVAFSADGKTMFSRGGDDVIRTWDALTGKELGQFTEPKGTQGATFSPDGKTVALSNTDGTLRIHATADGKQLHQVKGHPNGVSSMAFSPDGSTLASRGSLDNIVRVFDVAKGTERKQITLPGANPNAGGGAVVIRGSFVGGGQPIAFSPDGLNVAIALAGAQAGLRPGANPGDGTVRVFDINTGKEVRQIVTPPSRPVSNLAYSPDGRVIAAESADQSITLLEIASGRERLAFNEPVNPVQPNLPPGVVAVPARFPGLRTGNAALVLAFSPDGDLVASRGSANSVIITQLSTGKSIGTLKGHEGAVLGAAFTPDGKRMATSSADTTVLVWDVASLERTASARDTRLDIKSIEAMWNDLAAENGIQAAKCIDTLATDPKQTTAFIAERVKPAAPVDVKKLDQWLADLDSANFQKRSQATSELEKLGELAVPALRKLIETATTVETRRRVEDLLEKATTGVLTSEQLRMVRAIESLEKMATPESRQLLQTLASGAPGALQTRHAQAALNRTRR